MSWEVPDGHIDTDWIDEANAHDNNTGTQATSDAVLVEGDWTDYLILTYSSTINTNKLRLCWDTLNYNAIATIQIWVHNSSGWTLAYSGKPLVYCWYEKEFTEVDNVDQVRIRARKAAAGFLLILYVKELHLWKLVGVSPRRKLLGVGR